MILPRYRECEARQQTRLAKQVQLNNKLSEGKYNSSIQQFLKLTRIFPQNTFQILQRRIKNPRQRTKSSKKFLSFHRSDIRRPQSDISLIFPSIKNINILRRVLGIPSINNRHAKL